MLISILVFESDVNQMFLFDIMYVLGSVLALKNWLKP